MTDPRNPDPNDETPTRMHVFESTDGGATFPVDLFAAEPGLQLTFLEVPLGEPGTLYLSWTSSKTGNLRNSAQPLRIGRIHESLFPGTQGGPGPTRAIDAAEHHQVVEGCEGEVGEHRVRRNRGSGEGSNAGWARTVPQVTSWPDVPA